MSALRILWYYLWLAPHVLLALVLYGMARRGLRRQFPMFFLYAGFEILQTALLLAVSQRISYFGSVYLQVYAVGLAISTAIRFGVIHELFCHFFHRYPALSKAGRLLFGGATLALLLVAVGLAISAPGNVPDHVLKEAPYFSLKTSTLAADRAASVLQCGLLISLFSFSRYFALSWRSPAFGIALGMGAFASAELATTALRLYVVASDRVFDLATMGIYHLCVVVWIWYVLPVEREPRITVKALPKYDLEIWNQELQRLLQQ
ncbi:MAG: hypothetical protein WB711_10360 [Terriglobales bacterium]